MARLLARGTDAAVVFKWSLEHGNSIIHGLETSSIHLDPSLPLSLQAPARPHRLSKWAFTPSSLSSFTVNCYSKRNPQPTLLVFVDCTLLKGSAVLSRSSVKVHKLSGEIFIPFFRHAFSGDCFASICLFDRGQTAISRAAPLI